MKELIIKVIGSEEALKLFKDVLCDGGLEDSIYESMSMHDIRCNFKYDNSTVTIKLDEV